MKFHHWSGSDSDYSQEYIQIINLRDILKKWSEEIDIETHLMTNFYVGGEEIDGLIIIPNNIVVIDLKSGSGTIEGLENGDWICKQDDKNQFPINPGRKNPLNQARDKRWALINYLDKKKEEIFSSQQKANQMSFEHTSSFILFDGKISWDKNQVPKNIWPWFDVLSIDKLPEKIKSIRSSILSLTSEESWLIPTLLNLSNKDKKIDKVLIEEPQIISEKNTSVHEKSKDPLTMIKDKKSDEIITGHNSLIRGIFTGTDPNDKAVILIKTHGAKTWKVFLNDTFYSAKEDLKKLISSREKLISKGEIAINLINVAVEGKNIYLKDELESLLVIEPAWLINVSVLAEFSFCQRSLFNGRYSLRHQKEIMIRGSIVHEVFESILKNPSDLEKQKDVLNESFSNRALDFVLTDTDYKEMYRSFIVPHLNALIQHSKISMDNIRSVNTERFIINPILGLKGKIDAVITEIDGIKAIELKTGKSWGSKVKYGHDLQAQAYTLMMEMKFTDEKILFPSVIYSGDYEKVGELRERYQSNNINIEQPVEFQYDDKAHVITMRNKLVLADYLFTLEYGENPKKCKNCGEASICYDLYELELEHDLSNTPLFINDNHINKYSLEEKVFFNKYNRLLTEEYRVIKEAQGEYLAKDIVERLASGKCVKIDTYKILSDNECILNCINESELRESDGCLLSDNKGPIYGECLEVVVSNVTRNSITIKSRVKLEFEPAFIDVYSSETIFERNYSAIYALINQPSLKKLKDILINGSLPGENKQININVLDSGVLLGKNQKKCIELSLGIEDYLLIQGPPGTGKTLTIAMMVDVLFKKKKSILISCYTHRAIDESIRKILKYAPDVPIYRLGSRQKIPGQDNIVLEEVINSCSQLDEKINKAKEIIANKPVYIGTTNAWLSGNYDNLIGDSLYDVAIIDEATQVLLPNALGVVRLAKKFILVGDHNQLPPVIQSSEARELSNTLFEILYEREYGNDSNKVMLDVQHRMPDPIAKFISKEFYNDKLITSIDTKSRKLEVDLSGSSLFEILNPDNPLTLVNIDTNKSKNMIRTSPEETKIIVEIVSELLNAGVKPDDIGIIAPFRAQVADIRRALESNLSEFFENSSSIKKIVDTVDRFQGDERDVIIFSLTLTDKVVPEIINDKKRLNVAISRARRKFIGVGNWELVDRNETLKNLREYAKISNGCKFISKD